MFRKFIELLMNKCIFIDMCKKVRCFFHRQPSWNTKKEYGPSPTGKWSKFPMREYSLHGRMFIHVPSSTVVSIWKFQDLWPQNISLKYMKGIISKSPTPFLGITKWFLLPKFFLDLRDFLGDQKICWPINWGIPTSRENQNEDHTMRGNMLCTHTKILSCSEDFEIHSTHSARGRFNQQWHGFRHLLPIYSCILSIYDLLSTPTTVYVFVSNVFTKVYLSSHLETGIFLFVNRGWDEAAKAWSHRAVEEWEIKGGNLACKATQKTNMMWKSCCMI